MGKSRADSFVTELPLAVMPPEERQLLVRLDVARQVYNAYLGARWMVLIKPPGEPPC